MVHVLSESTRDPLLDSVLVVLAFLRPDDDASMPAAATDTSELVTLDTTDLSDSP
jgi:hypothetical protein